MTPRSLTLTIALLIANLVMLALNGWSLWRTHKNLALIREIMTNNAEIATRPCHQGMTLQPGETCSLNLPLPVPPIAQPTPPRSGI